MAVIRKAIPEDFEKALPLFEKFNNGNLSRENWQILFQDNWNSGEDYIGFVLVDGEHIGGFISLLFSKRKVEGREEKFCNVSSWVVEDRYRNQSLFLLMPVLKLKDCTVTILTCSLETYKVACKLGFTDLETHTQIIPPVPSIGALIKKCKIEINNDTQARTLTEESQRLWRDHERFGLLKINIQTSQGDCLILATRIIRKNLPFIQVHHTNNISVFIEFSGRISASLCLRLKAISVLMDRRWLAGRIPVMSISWPLPHPRVFKSATLQAKDIDSLYSELPVLNI
jgi:hypothetical protein